MFAQLTPIVYKNGCHENGCHPSSLFRASWTTGCTTNTVSTTQRTWQTVVVCSQSTFAVLGCATVFVTFVKCCWDAVVVKSKDFRPSASTLVRLTAMFGMATGFQCGPKPISVPNLYDPSIFYQIYPLDVWYVEWVCVIWHDKSAQLRKKLLRL